MPWIKWIDEDQAEGDLKAQFNQLGAADDDGKVDHILKIHSLHPQSLRTHYALYRNLMYGKSPVRRPQREMIAVVVSAINGCHY